MIHVFTFVKGDETLSMAYTSEGIRTMDEMAPIEDGWEYDSITDIPKLDMSYADVKALWEKSAPPSGRAGYICEFDDQEKALDMCDCGIEGGC